MKCKYCGKELNERQRFCDNCGRTVRHIQNSSTQRSTSRPSQSRPERRTGGNVQYSGQQRRQNGNNPDSFKRYDKYMRDKQKKARELKMKKIRFRRFMLFIILIALIISVIGAVVAFNTTRNSGVTTIPIPEESTMPENEETVDETGFIEGDILTENENGENATLDSSPSPSPAGKTSASPSAGTKNSASPTAKSISTLKDGYTSYKEATTGIACPYPSDFEKSDSTSTATKVSITDGKAEMRINTEKATTQDTAQSLLKSYSSGIGVDATETSASDGIYSISFTRNGKFNRRTGVVYGGRHIYYDFSCPSDMTSNSDYGDIIEYADEQLTKQIQKLNSEE